MRFKIKQASCGSERIGCLVNFGKSSNAIIETPTAALLTQGGSVVHLTAEVLLKVFTDPQLLWVPLANSFHLEQGVRVQGDGVAKFAGLPEHMTCVTFNNINEVIPQGHIETDKMPLWTRNGKKMISADRYMDLMEVFKPDIILAVADSCTSLIEGNKRIGKSVERTCNLLDTCVKRYKDSKTLQESSLIGVVVGAGHPKRCDVCIDHVLKHKEVLSGIVLSGITDGTDDSYKVSNETLEGVFKKVGDALPKDLVRIIEGCWNPIIIMSAIEHGWDIFDGTYPVKLTNSGLALALDFDVTQESGDICMLDLIDVRYEEDFRPVLSGCECLTCRKHTRAYIRHLLNTREMLASVLLSIHNLHHFNEMFRHARHHIASNTFHIYKQHITKQYESYKMTQISNDKKSDVLSKIDNETIKNSAPKKKPRVRKRNIATTEVANSS